MVVGGGCSGFRVRGVKFRMRWVIAGVVGFLSVVAVAAPGARAVAPDDDLPEGEGKKILVASCTSCHDLTEVTKFRGYYDRKQWRDIVVTMMEYGAPVDERQVDVLADYLAQHLGK
jgi:competence protein ComEA